MTHQSRVPPAHTQCTLQRKLRSQNCMQTNVRATYVCVCVCVRYPTRETFEYYMKATGHGTEAKTLAVHDKYGLNKFDVPVPAFGMLLKEHLVAPFFVFQVRGALRHLCQRALWHTTMRCRAAQHTRVF